MAKLLLLLCSVHILQADFVRLSDANRAIHFADFSNDSISINGSDARFWNIGTPSEDYAMMSWVQIQEYHSSSSMAIWRIASNTYKKTPILIIETDGKVLGRVSTTTANVNISLDVANTDVPIWRHVTIVAWGSDSYAQICVKTWNESLQCVQTGLSESVVTFDTSSTVKIGAGSFYPTAKMQILDLRYYNGQWLTHQDIDTIVSGISGCSEYCSSGCWGPGNYSWNEFITIIDPLVGYSLNGDQNMYKIWSGDDSFLQGRTYDSEDVAVTGWFFENDNVGTQPTYIRVRTKEGECYEVPGCQLGSLTRDPSNKYEYCHANTNNSANACVSIDSGDAVSTWRFVAGSTCAENDSLKVCYGDRTTQVDCQITTNSIPIAKFAADEFHYISVGSQWNGQSHMSIKDARYYYSECLVASEMDTIRSNMMCMENCETCYQPSRCSTWVDGFVSVEKPDGVVSLTQNTCEPCDCPCATCTTDTTTCASCIADLYLYNGQCVDDCGSGFYGDIAFGECKPCDPCCSECTDASNMCTVCSSTCYNGNSGACEQCLGFWEECTGPTNEQCTTCISGFYLQNSTTWVSSCGSGYWTNDSSFTCDQCHQVCATCSDSTSNGCQSCSSGYFLQPLPQQNCLDTCPTRYYKDTQAGDGVCYDWNPYWEQCDGPTDAECSYCAHNFAMQPDPNFKTCRTGWPAGYWEDAGTVRVCTLCNALCEECNGPLNTDCTKCLLYYFLQPNSTICEYDSCPDGYWKNTNTRECDACDVNGVTHTSCIVCHTSCATWSGTSSTDCTLCNSYATLESGSCNCIAGYFQDEAFACVQCDAACAQCTGPGTESCQQCNFPYFRLDHSWKSTWDIQYYGDTQTNQCVACPAGCNSCSSSTQCTSCIISYFMQPDGLTCSQTCPTAWFGDAITQSCGECPANCEVCASATQWTSCADPYVLRVDGLCYNSCQEAYYADTNRECLQCFGFCATCVGPDSDMCLTCADGLARSEPFSNQSTCLCGGWASANKEAKLACINYSYSQEETSDIDIIDDLNYYIESEDLNVADLREIVSVVSNLNITDETFTLTTDTLLEASRKTMISINHTSNSVSAADSNIEIQVNVDTAEDLYGSYVTTDSGSGVRIPIDLNKQNLTSSDDVLIASVVSVTSKSNDFITLSDYDIVSVEIEKLVGNQKTEHVNYENLTTNFTIIFGGQSFNTSESLECVYLYNSTWITDGCWLDYFSVTRAWCLCNHLSSFSMRKAKNEANQDNNAEATVQFENAANYNLDTNQAPLYVVSSILIVYLTVFIILRRSERQPKQTKPVDKINSSDGKETKARPQKQSDPAQLSNLSCSADSSDAIIRINAMNKTNSDDHTANFTFRWAFDVPQRSTNERLDDTTSRNQMTKQEILEKKAAQHRSLKNRFLTRHPFFGVFWLGTDNRMLRSEKLTVLLVIIMTGIFVTGLFYDRSQDGAETEEEDKTFYETIQSFSWADFWIIVFSMSITIPIPIILRNLFRRKKINLDKDVKSQIRRQRLKKFAGFTLSACIVLWSAWSCISFSLSFGYNTTTQWMLSFLGAEILDLLFKDNITTITIVILTLLIGMIQMRRKNSKVNIVNDIKPIVWIDVNDDDKSDSSNSPNKRKRDNNTNDAVNEADAEIEMDSFN